MISFRFWKFWSKSTQVIFWIISLLWLTTWFFSIFLYYKGYEDAYPWVVKSDVNETNVTIEKFDFSFLQFPVEGKMFYLNQQLIKELPNFKNIWHYVYAFLFIVCLSLLTTVFSYLKSWWYFIGLIALILIWLNSHWDATLPLNAGLWVGYFLTVFMAFIHFFIHFKKIFPKFIHRFSFFIVLHSLISVALYFFSDDKSFVLQTNYSIIIPLCLSILFLIMVGFDPLYFFLYITTDTKSIKKGTNFFNYLIISVLYLANVFLAFLKQRGILEIQIFTIPEWFLLGFTTLIGFFIHERRIEGTGNAIDFSPFGAIQYMSFAFITCLTLCYGYISGSDSIVHLMNLSILYTQCFIGLSFFIYSVGKFSTYLFQNFKVYEIVFKAFQFPIHLVRLGGLLAITAIISYYGQKEPAMLRNAYYSQIGLSYYSLNNFQLSKEYLKEAIYYSPSAYQSNFGIAHIHFKEAKFDNAIETYKRMLYLYNNQAIFSNLAYCYSNPFGSIETLKEGISRCKKNEALLNNLGIVYSNTHLIDSSYFYLKKAFQNGISLDVFRTNLLYLLIKKNIKGGDELTFIKYPQNNNFLEINRICYAKVFEELIHIAEKKPTITTTEDILRFNNEIMYSCKPSKPYLEKIEEIIQNDSTGYFRADFSFIRSILWLIEG